MFVLGNPLRYRDPTGHYHSDVHQDLTQKWTYLSVLQMARTYGMGIREANALATNLSEQVANADQGVDCKSCSDSSARRSGVLHWMSHSEAARNMAEVVQSGDPEAFGRTLHSIQDYYSHFGQGFNLERDDAGQELYRKLLSEDDLDPALYGGLDLETRMENAGDWGHSWTTFSTEFDADEFLWSDEWDLLMVSETKDWIWLFLQIYFELNYGPLPEDEYQED
jgi:hypothetical protein